MDGKWGYINKIGEMVIEPKFDDAGFFAENGLATVGVNGKLGFINETGKMVTEARFDVTFGCYNFFDFDSVFEDDIDKRNKRCEILRAKAEEKKCDILFREYQVAVEKEKVEAVAINKELSILSEQYDALSTLKTDWSRIERIEHRIDENLENVQKEIRALDSERNTLGIFAGKRKREIKERIITLEENRQSLLQEKQMLQKEKKGYANLSDIENELENIAEPINHHKKFLETFEQTRPSLEIRKNLSDSEYGKKRIEEYDSNVE